MAFLFHLLECTELQVIIVSTSKDGPLQDELSRFTVITDHPPRTQFTLDASHVHFTCPFHRLAGGGTLLYLATEEKHSLLT